VGAAADLSAPASCYHEAVVVGPPSTVRRRGSLIGFPMQRRNLVPGGFMHLPASARSKERRKLSLTVPTFFLHFFEVSTREVVHERTAARTLGTASQRP
jgi:hypothetical protein